MIGCQLPRELSAWQVLIDHVFDAEQRTVTALDYRDPASARADYGDAL